MLQLHAHKTPADLNIHVTAALTATKCNKWSSVMYLWPISLMNPGQKEQDGEGACGLGA